MYAAIALLVMCNGANYEHLAKAVIIMHNTVPVPAPAPTPSTVCQDCDGRGKVGDGKTMITCATCKGTGKPVVDTKASPTACGPNGCPPKAQYFKFFKRGR